MLTEVCYKSFPCPSVPWLFHARIIMLAVSIDLPFGHFFQAGLKLMALIYPCPGLTYPVILDTPKSYPYYQFGKERLRAVIWKFQSMGAEPAEGLHFRVVYLLGDSDTGLPVAVLPSHTCWSCSVSTPAPHSSLPHVELKCCLLPL